MQDASQWYKENKVLRRRTLLIDNDTVDEGVDTDEVSSDHDLDNLRDSVKALSQEVAQLQTELNSAKLLEFETSEINISLTQELEAEKTKNSALEQDLQQLRSEYEQILRVSNLMKNELEQLRDIEKQDRDSLNNLRKEADMYKKERNVLAHQSTLLLQGLNDSDSLDSVMLLEEIENLKRSLEDERNKYNLEINVLQVMLILMIFSCQNLTFNRNVKL